MSSQVKSARKSVYIVPQRRLTSFTEVLTSTTQTLVRSSWARCSHWNQHYHAGFKCWMKNGRFACKEFQIFYNVKWLIRPCSTYENKKSSPAMLQNNSKHTVHCMLFITCFQIYRLFSHFFFVFLKKRLTTLVLSIHNEYICWTAQKTFLGVKPVRLPSSVS